MTHFVSRNPHQMLFPQLHATAAEVAVEEMAEVEAEALPVLLLR